MLTWARTPAPPTRDQGSPKLKSDRPPSQFIWDTQQQPAASEPQVMSFLARKSQRYKQTWLPDTITPTQWLYSKVRKLEQSDMTAGFSCCNYSCSWQQWSNQYSKPVQSLAANLSLNNGMTDVPHQLSHSNTEKRKLHVHVCLWVALVWAHPQPHPCWEREKENYLLVCTPIRLSKVHSLHNLKDWKRVSEKQCRWMEWEKVRTWQRDEMAKQKRFRCLKLNPHPDSNYTFSLQKELLISQSSVSQCFHCGMREREVEGGQGEGGGGGKRQRERHTQTQRERQIGR